MCEEVPSSNPKGDILTKKNFETPRSNSLLMAKLGRDVVFEDFFPSMIEKLGAEGFLKELTNGFKVLMDEEREVITFESLKKNSELLGLKGNMSDDEVMCMLNEGDLDGDGCLNEMEFCVLMVRLSPDLMDISRMWLEETLAKL